MGIVQKKYINSDFFKIWSSDMAYILGYFVADGCITEDCNRIKNKYTFNITSVDLEHLEKIAEAMNSDYKISKKSGGSKSIAYQIQVRNSVLAEDLINLGVYPRKTYNLQIINVPEKYFSDFARGFFDGDGSVYIYNVNSTKQIKSSFVAVSLSFMKKFNADLCKRLGILEKAIHKMINKRLKRMPQYNISLYIDDSEKLAKFMYGNNPALYLNRKKEVFDKWESVKRRHYKKENYPSKIGWYLNKKVLN
ncbi:MAG: hypothetical protein AAB529_02295 [Patescibacteria group bacterium]